MFDISHEFEKEYLGERMAKSHPELKCYYRMLKFVEPK